MSYISDKEKMKKDVQERKNTVLFAIKITFFAFAVALLVFCITFVLSAIFGWGEDSKKTDNLDPSISQNFNIDGFDTFNGGVVGYVGQTPTFKKFIVLSDGVISDIQHNVDINTEGTYPVKYTITDTDGNVSYFTLQYVVKKAEYSDAMLMETIARIAEQLGITKSMTKVEQVRAIYKYVNSSSTVKFTDESNIPNIDRNKWESKIREVYANAAEGVIALQDKLGWYENSRAGIYADKWDSIKAILSEAPSSEEMLVYLDSIELDINEYKDTYKAEKLQNAMWFSKDLKDRYTVLWLYFSLFHRW